MAAVREVDADATLRFLAQLPRFTLKTAGHIAAHDRCVRLGLGSAPLRVERTLADAREPRAYVACLESRAYWSIAAAGDRELERLLDLDELWETAKPAIAFGSLDASLVGAVSAAAARRGLEQDWVEEVKLFTFERAAPPEVPPVPAGAELGELREEDAETVALNWTYVDSKNPAKTVALVRELIALLPTSCVRVGGELAAWCLVQSYGAIGMLHTAPAHRRRGLGLAAMAALTRRIVEGDPRALTRTPFCYAVAGNTASMELFSRMGYACAGDAVWIAFRPHSAPRGVPGMPPDVQHGSA
eukprot:tig00021537_g22309.t1